jgi:hypothetical protein
MKIIKKEIKHPSIFLGYLDSTMYAESGESLKN